MRTGTQSLPLLPRDAADVLATTAHVKTALNEPEARRMASPSLTARARARAINGVLESSSDAERGLKRYRRCYLCESTFNASATTAAAARKRGKRSYGIPRTQTRAPRGPWGTRGVFFRCVIHDEERKNAHYPRMVRMSVRPLEPPPSVARSASRGLSFPLAALADFAASRDSLFRVRLKSFYVAASTIEAAPPPPPPRQAGAGWAARNALAQ